MATTVTPGVEQITVSVDDAGRDDFGGIKIWMSPTNGFTPNDATNLVFDGPVRKYTIPDLTAGVQQYLKVAQYSAIDKIAYTMSAQYTATPTPPTVAAENITGLTIRGKNAFAGSFGTKGSTLVGATLAAAGTLNVQNTVDFPSSGSAVIFSSNSARDFDTITYTGKTGTTLTGVSGVLAHSDGEVIIPGALKSMTIDANTNEMRFYGDRGDGTIDLLAAIGIAPTSGGSSDSVVAKFGTADTTHAALEVQGKPLLSYTVSWVLSYGAGAALRVGKSASGSGDPAAVFSNNAGGRALSLSSGTGFAGGVVGTAPLEIFQPARYNLNSRAGPQISFEVSSYDPDNAFGAAGELSMGVGAKLYVFSGGVWKQFWRDGDAVTVPSPAAADDSAKASPTSWVRDLLMSLGIGDLTTNPLPADNINNDTTNPTGTYNVTAATAGTHPLAAAASILYHVITGNSGMQMLTYNVSGRSFVRPRAAAAWGAWVELAGLDFANTWSLIQTFTQRATLTGGYLAAAQNYDHCTAATTVNTTSTLAVNDLLNGGMIRSTPAAPITLTLPLATDLDTTTGLTATSKSLDFSVENISGVNAITMAVNTGITNSTRTLVVAAGSNVLFRLRRTGTGAWMLFRIAG